MEKDPTIALELLIAADHILEQADPLKSLALRESLASDILMLKAVNRPDFEGIYLGLNAKITHKSNGTATLCFNKSGQELDDSLYAQVAKGTEADVKSAVAAAKSAFKSFKWNRKLQSLRNRKTIKVRELE